MSPKVAVITRTKNRTILLKRAVESVLSQSYGNWVHVIVNDGGEQESVDELLATYTDRYSDRLQVIHNPQSLGMEAASNKGVTGSESTYIVIHDDDDSWEPKFLETSVGMLENTPFPSVRGVTTHTNQIFESIDKKSIRETTRLDFDPHLTSVSLPEITEINKFMPISFLFRRDALEYTGLFDEALPVIGDWEFNIRFLSRFDVIVIKERLANYHIRVDGHEDYANTVTAKQEEHLFHRDLIVNKHIRADLESGRLSMGMLLAWGDYFHRINNNTWRLVQLTERLKHSRPLKFARKLFRI